MSSDTHQVPTRPGTPDAGLPGGRAGAASYCMVGHLVLAEPGESPARDPIRCPTCDALTISRCPGCQEPIPGLDGPGGGAGAAPGGAAVPRSPKPPQYCLACGRPFPWTEQVISAVRMAFRELVDLDRYERDQLRRSLEHITHETPETRAAVERINAALARIGGETAHSLRALFLDIAVESVKPLLRAG